MKILAADAIDYHESTDLREVTLPRLGRNRLKQLEAGLAEGTVLRLPGDLYGWGDRNATLHDLVYGSYYHAKLEEEETP